MKYNNPVRRGFYPDPSVIRVGSDFYMVNSSFQYFPCIPISHSRDMVHWETVGHAISDPSYLDLSGIKDSHGIWAPDIHYDDKTETYYITATMRLNDKPEDENYAARQQLIMKSKRPEGPYSKPVWLDINSIDPSLFFDDDGRKYMIISRAASAYELNRDCTRLISGRKTVWEGTGERCAEGPHVMKHGGYYYAIVAEGGTGYGHGINIARSKELFGEYEPCPYNPVMRQKDPEAPIQRAGHGKLVDDGHGGWWAYYLCGRRNEGNYTTLGRETALDPVEWTEDGWFKINSGKGPSLINDCPDLPEFTGESRDFLDDFDSSALGLEWEFVRSPDYSRISLSDEVPSALRMYTSEGQMNELRARNILLHREEELHYTAETELRFIPVEGTRAGMTCYYSTATYIRFNSAMRNGKRILELVLNKGDKEETVFEAELSAERLRLRVITSGQKRSFYYCTADSEKNEFVKAAEIAPCTFLCDEGVPGDRKRHTGTLVGIFAHADTDIRIPADFEYFKINY